MPNRLQQRRVFHSGSRFVGALDAFTSDLAVVWSVRRLLGSYTGPVFRLRVNTTGNPEFDCYTAAEAVAYCGANSGFIRWFYDQSGNAIDLGNSSASMQPRIVNAGSLDTAGARFSSHALDTASVAFSNFAGAQNVQVAAIVTQLSLGGMRFFDFGPDLLSAWMPSSGQIYWDVPFPGGRINVSTPVGFENVQRSVSFERTSGTANIRIDGTVAHTASVSGSISGTSIFRIGSTISGSGPWNGHIRDFVIWKNNTNATARIAALAA